MPPSRILLVHNSYQQPGGEDAVFAAESALLRRHGHNVLEFTEDNWRINGMSRIAVAARAVWSSSTKRKLFDLLLDFRPDVAHFHNTFPLISPSAYAACRKAGVPVVQTLHNYRLLCPAATFYRNGTVCEDCLGKTPPWPGVGNACYRGSRVQSAVVATMLTVHRTLKTWLEKVDIYIALAESARMKFIQGGLPPKKVTVKSNFVHPDPGVGHETGDYALFVGRLSPEKGLGTLLKAWQHLKDTPLKIAGDGSFMGEVQAFVRTRNLSRVEALGRCVHEDVLTLLRGARFLVFPSEWYECFPVTIAEAFACGVPVVATRLGSMGEIVGEGCTGLLFNPGDPEDLAVKVRWAVDHPHEMRRMGQNARRVYEEKYTADKNYRMLLDIYDRAIKEASLRKKVGHGVSA